MNRAYLYKNCDGCRKAKKWLASSSASFEEVAIRESPPSRKELGEALRSAEGNLKKLFNVSGGDYRAMRLKDRLPSLSEGEAFDLLESNGNLVKRPFLATGHGAAAGFDESLWKELLGLD